MIDACAPVPVSGTIDKDTRRKRLLSVPRALVPFLTVVPAVILKVTVASPESCHRSTDPPFTGVVAALSDLRQEIEKKTKDNKLHLAGFFSTKLRGSQPTWLPCEVEALAIAVATKHFSPYLIQSHQKACILTDSKPCIQAYEKLSRRVFR